MAKNSFDSFMVPRGQVKTASAGTSPVSEQLLARLATITGHTKEASAGNAGSPPGHLHSPVLSAAAQSVAYPDPAVVGATDNIIDPQVALAGGNIADQLAGSAPHTGVIQPVRVSDATGNVDDNSAIINSVTNGKPVGAEKLASLNDACDMGRSMAHAYNEELQKIAFFNQYNEAAALLKESGVLDGYDVDGFDKVASADGYDPTEGRFLHKVASGADLSYSDIITAANEYVLFKEAEANVDAEAEKIASDIINEAADEVAEEIIQVKLASDESAHADAAVAGTEKVASELTLEQAAAILKIVGKI